MLSSTLPWIISIKAIHSVKLNFRRTDLNKEKFIPSNLIPTQQAPLHLLLKTIKEQDNRWFNACLQNINHTVESSTALDCTTSKINCTEWILIFKKTMAREKREMAYNSFKCSTIFFVTRESINKKFVITTFLHCSLKKLYGDLGRNNLPFFNHVLNHRAKKRKW